MKKSTESKESVLETSIRMVRQYGLGYVFVDQSASLLSKAAFANSCATIALSQKLKSDVSAIASAMNLSDDQKQAISTLPIGTAVVRLADEFPESFLVKIRKCPIIEGSVPDSAIRAPLPANTSDTASNRSNKPSPAAVPAISAADNKENENRNNQHIGTSQDTRPPSPRTSANGNKSADDSKPPHNKLNREEIRFLADISVRALSTTVSRYQRLNLSRRKGNAIRQSLAAAGLIEAVTVATRSGQVVLYQLTENGCAVCEAEHIDPGPRHRESLEHRSDL